MDVELAMDGPTGLQKARSGEYDLVAVDLMLPGFNGLDICRAVRKPDARTPILMLTARSTELDRVLGLEIGANDYITKPFSVYELMARVKATFRWEANSMTARYSCCAIVIFFVPTAGY